MYPFVRMALELQAARRAPRLGLSDVHESRHVCWPWDLDFWAELNNGRTLTLYDLGRVPFALRLGIVGPLRRRRWSMTVAGSSVRYRRRVRVFRRILMRSRIAGWDDRFIYVEQGMWLADGSCAGHALLRMAVAGRDGIVPTSEVLAEMGQPGAEMPPPDWVRAWAEADAQRPWPPMPDL